LECSSSPTSGTVFPQVRGLLWFFRVHIVHTLASDLMFRVCVVPDRPIGCVGGAADYGGPRTALWGLFWGFILVPTSLGFSCSQVHGGSGRVQHDLLIILWVGLGLRPVRNFRSDTCSCRSAGERHDMAADPEQIVSSLSLASREAGRPRGRVEGNWWVMLPWSSHQVTRRRSHHFSPHRPIRILGIRRRCPRCSSGGGWPCCPQSDFSERGTRR
jgi:hypothetical protein